MLQLPKAQVFLFRLCVPWYPHPFDIVDPQQTSSADIELKCMQVKLVDVWKVGSFTPPFNALRTEGSNYPFKPTNQSCFSYYFKTNNSS